jgi:hypothetical protein
MKKIVTTSLFVLATIALLGLSSASAAEELWVVKDGVMDKEALAPKATEVAKDHVGCGGEPVDGKISLRVLVDRPMLEICGNAGRVYITRKRASPGPSAISKVKAFVAGGHAKLVQLEVYELESIWNRENER